MLGISTAHVHLDTGKEVGHGVNTTFHGVGSEVAVVDAYLRLYIDGEHLVNVRFCLQAALHHEVGRATAAVVGALAHAQTEQGIEVEPALVAYAQEGVGHVEHVVGTYRDAAEFVNRARLVLAKAAPYASTVQRGEPLAKTEMGHIA